MQKAEIVIGGAFGDEGKGLVTDYLASRATGKACVVRFNGGAQAGHTVQTPDGRRHVFSHFGSGSFAGLPTYLSPFFVCNPIVFCSEYQKLAALGVTPKLAADPACPVTTPYDIMLNQIVEQARGHKRHGSVGVGFGETLERQNHASYALCLADMQRPSSLRAKLDAIREYWVYERLAALGVQEIGDEWHRRFHNDAICERYMQDTEWFLSQTVLAPVPALHNYEHLIFEGAQGLLLDQDRGWFPHVTRSYTGIRNAAALLRTLGVTGADVYYLTRAYTTRHGAGPLPHALPEQPYKNISDPTNKPNPYQGSLRFAWFDMDLFRDTVLRDMQDAGHLDLRPHLSMSCLDQIDDRASYIADGVLRTTEPERLARLASRSIGAKTMLTSFGPTRATMRQSLVVEGVDRTFQAFEVPDDDHVAIQLDVPLLDQRGELLVNAFA